MGSKISSQISSFLLVTFVLWYLLRRTNLGSDYTRDMMNIPRNIGEGLQTTQEYIRR